MNGIIPTKARTEKVKEFLEKQYYFALGKSSAWLDPTGIYQTDLHPPQENPNSLTVTDTIVYKKPTLITPVIETAFDANSSKLISLDSKFYLPVSPQEIDTLSPTEIYFKLDVYLNDLLTEENFRIAGLFSGLEAVPNINSNQLNRLTPEQVENPGTLEWIINIRPVTLTSNSAVTLAFIRQF